METIASSVPYRMCTRCIMDTSDPEITFDALGRCNHCTRYFERVAKEVFRGAEGQTRLAAIVDKIKRAGAGKPYDCLIGLSGGTDSTMVAYTVKRLGLRPVAVHFDNGWNSELAVDNIHRIVEKLGIDLMTHVVDWEEFVDLQLAFLKASVANSEIPTDHAINALMLNTAAKLGIKYIIGGGNVATEGIMPFSWCYYAQDLKHVKAIHALYGKVPLNTMPMISLPRFLYYVLIRGIRIIPMLNYIDYNKAAAKDLLFRKLGWRDYGGKHFESIYTKFYQSYILPRKFGYDKRRPHLSTLVCSGEISREDALREMQKDPYPGGELNDDKAFVLKKLRLSAAEFETLMTAPLKTWRDYPSNAFVFHELAGLRARFKKIATRA